MDFCVPDEPVEVVNVRMRAVGRLLPSATQRRRQAGKRGTVTFSGLARVWSRSARTRATVSKPTGLRTHERSYRDKPITGPAIVEQNELNSHRSAQTHRSGG